MQYQKRIFDDELEFRLESSGAVLIEGPKWCGKTTTAKQQSKSVIELQNPDFREVYRSTAQVKPSLLLEGENPRLIDEWQEIPQLWDAVRSSVDQKNRPGLYILTGSNSINFDQVFHSGTGRIARMRMETMSLFESAESNGSVSLQALFNNPDQDLVAQSSLTLEQLVYATCRGGWPAFLSRKTKRAQLQMAKDYVDSVCNTDISTIDGVKRNTGLALQILKSYARNISTLAKTTNIRKDVLSFSETISLPTIDSYLTALRKLFVIEDIEAWCPAIRSATAIRSSLKRGFVDPSIAVAILGLEPDYFKTDLKTFGFIFESLCMRDLRTYTASMGGKLSYYRDRYDLEADCVLHLRDGRYALIEFKLGGKEIDMGAEHLLEIKRLVKEYNVTETQMKLREPDLLIVITGTQFGYRRPDGVYVLPIGSLKP